ncbi:killer toxin resistant protein [Blastocladiella emersonii ATCC 22665]|nr:killer toxin resistant protein [Blastocladiella emersonii ATCC 22665]
MHRPHAGSRVRRAARAAVGAAVFTLALALLAGTALAESTPADASEFRVSMTANWRQDPVVEAYDLIASHNLTLADELLHSAGRHHDPDTVLTTAGLLGLDTTAQSLVAASLAFRERAPRVAAFFDVYDAAAGASLPTDLADCSYLVAVADGAPLSCDLAEIAAAVTDPAAPAKPVPLIPDLDRAVFGDAVATRTIVVYGNPRTRGFAFGWARLRELPVRIALRYRPLPDAVSKPDPIHLAGYLVHLQVKDTEYKVTDDRTDLATTTSSSSDAAAPAPVLRKIDDKALEHAGAAVAAHVTSLDDFVAVSADLPLTLPALIDRGVPANATVDLSRMARATANAVNALWVNGMPLRLPTADAFTLLAAVQHEHRLRTRAAGLGVDAATLDAVLARGGGGAGGEGHVDRFDLTTVADSDVVWLNDLEDRADPRYAAWPTELHAYLTGGMRGNLPHVARNGLTVHAFLDLADVNHASVLSSLYRFAAGGVALRVGVVPLVADPEDREALSNQLALEFTDMAAQQGPDAAVPWLLRVVTGQQALTKRRRRDLAADGKLLAQLARVRTKYGVPAATGELFVNGAPVPLNAMFDGSIGWYVDREAQRLAQLVMMGVVSDKSSDPLAKQLARGLWPRRTEFAFGDRPAVFAETTMTADVPQVDAEADDAEADDADQRRAMRFAHVALAGLIDPNLRAAAEQAQSALGFALEPHAKLQPGADPEPAIIINGRRISLAGLEHDDDDATHALATLVRVEFARRVRPLVDPRTRGTDDDVRAFWRASVIRYWNQIEVARLRLPASPAEPRSDPLAVLPCHATPAACLRAPARVGNDVEPIRVVAVLDPVSEEAQALAPVLADLHARIPALDVTLVWHVGRPAAKPERFTRYVAPVNNGIPAAKFHGLPNILYTLAMQTPHPWVVEATASPLDLDNIVVPRGGAGAEFALTALLVEGSAEDTATGQPPAGTQFVLKQSRGVRAETIVMNNLGYFQLKARPGLWQLGLREGRSAEVYRAVDQAVLVDSFRGVELASLKVAKRKGMERASVLDEMHEKHEAERVDAGRGRGRGAGGWLAALGKLFGFGGSSGSGSAGSCGGGSSSDGRIHVMSVASGHLYERFLSIMMQSVVEHASRPVTFHLMGDFLSPSFKAFLPALADRFGFEYRLVSYAWPTWLRAQRVKQRTIWGYKILFLDVLFPLDLDRIVFVDADQVVRTDLAQLMDLDLQGRVWAYTPFCESRKEIEGFRFWKHGYWANHLRGKPYHISALYAVDLHRFRTTAAGDILRAQYQGLSADPNSLANLDQDLPNNLQHDLPIFSLDQDWLWCETWCSDASLTAAKTIDLCNNPMTKEPKLDRARRLIPEWETYDRRVEDLRRALAEQQTAEAAVPAPGRDEL